MRHDVRPTRTRCQSTGRRWAGLLMLCIGLACGSVAADAQTADDESRTLITGDTLDRAVELAAMEASLLAERERWMDVEMSLALAEHADDPVQHDKPRQGPPEHAQHGPHAGERPRDEGPMSDDEMARLAEGDGPSGRPGAGPPRRPTLEDLRKMVQVMKDVDPKLAEEFERLRSEDRREAFRLMMRHGPLLGRLAMLRERDEQAYALRVKDIRLGRETEALADQLRRLRQQDDADEAEVDRVDAELDEKLLEHFEVRQALRRHVLEKLRARLAEMEEGIELREQRQASIIADQKRLLLDGERTDDRGNDARPSRGGE